MMYLIIKLERPEFLIVDKVEKDIQAFLYSKILLIFYSVSTNTVAIYLISQLLLHLSFLVYVCYLTTGIED